MTPGDTPSGRLILFQTLGCHLCEEALTVILAIPRAQGAALDSVDIADDERLMERYGTRIPVLRRSDSGAELDWPFTSIEVNDFLGASPAANGEGSGQGPA